MCRTEDIPPSCAAFTQNFYCYEVTVSLLHCPFMVVLSQPVCFTYDTIKFCVAFKIESNFSSDLLIQAISIISEIVGK